MKLDRFIAAFVAGLVSLVLTIFLVIWLSTSFGLNLVGWSVAFIFPIGAFLCGLLASLGVFLAARFVDLRPTLALRIQLITIAVAAMPLIYLGIYLSATMTDGTRAADYVGFGEFTEMLLTKSHLRIGRGARDIGEVGNFGYLIGARNLIGFAIAGELWFRLLRMAPICNGCDLYLGRVGVLLDFFDDAERMVDVYKARADPARPDFTVAVASRFGVPKTLPGTFKLQTELFRCPGCGAQQLSDCVTILAASKKRLLLPTQQEWRLTDVAARQWQLPADPDLSPLFQRK